MSTIALALLLATAARASASHRRLLEQGAGPPPTAILVGATVGAALMALVLSISIVLWQRHKAAKATGVTIKAMDSEPHAKAQYSPGGMEEVPVCSLSFNEVQVATDGFKPEGLLSDAGHGSVHLGEGPNGEQWAVKRAKGVSLQGEHLFRNEVEFLAMISHESILPLLAYSNEGTEQILVFEYMPNGSLSSWLRPEPHDARDPLPFLTRLHIAVGVAEALRYLHSFSRPTIIHRDVKSASVLLDADFAPRLGALGLLKHLPGEALRMRMAGRKGYLDPEYFQSFKVTTKCDVYSFGVVLFELLTGCGPIIQVARADSNRPTTLAQWALQAVEEGKVAEILDPRMPQQSEEDCPREAVESFARVAASCVAPLRRDRPDMAKVAFLLAELCKAPHSSTAGPTALSRLKAGGHKVVPISS